MGFLADSELKDWNLFGLYVLQHTGQTICDSEIVPGSCQAEIVLPD